jgi:predicted O-methyltransferase YrrM
LLIFRSTGYADGQAGRLVPLDLRSRWHLLRGPTRRVLPQLVSQLPAIDIFLHDSLHAHHNMSLEFRRVWSTLRAGGVLLSDDVELNRAIEDFAARSGLAATLVAQEHTKASHFGVLVSSG